MMTHLVDVALLLKSKQTIPYLSNITELAIIFHLDFLMKFD